MIRIWNHNAQSSLSRAWDIPWRCTPDYTEDVRAVKTMQGGYARIDVRGGLPRVEESITLRGPSGLLESENGHSTPEVLREYLLSAFRNKSILTIYDSNSSRFYKGWLEEPPDQLTGNENFWEGQDSGEVELFFYLTARGSFLDFDNGEDSWAFPILAADPVDDGFYIAGDYAYLFTVGVPFLVAGSSSSPTNNGPYATASSSYNAETDRTRIQVTAVTGADGGGTITRTGNLPEDAI